MIVKHSGKQIVCCADCVEIARKVQIYIFHRHDLRISAACRTAFHAEHGTEGRLAQSNHCVFAYTSESVGKSYRRCGFPLSGGCGRYCRDKHEFPLFATLFQNRRIVDFRLVFAVIFNQIEVDTALFCNLANWKHFCALRNFDVRFIRPVRHIVTAVFVDIKSIALRSCFHNKIFRMRFGMPEKLFLSEIKNIFELHKNIFELHILDFVSNK